MWMVAGSDKLWVYEPMNVPLKSAGSSAKAVWAAWRCHAMRAPIVRFKAALMNAAEASGGLAFDHEESDDASGNALFHAVEIAADSPKRIKSKGKCLNHQNQHSVVTLFAVTGLQRISGLQQITTFLNMSNYLLRMSIHLASFLQEPGRVEIIDDSSPTQDDLAFVETLVSFVLGCTSDTELSMKSLERRLRNLFSVWNCNFHDQRGIIFHRCGGERCCAGGRNRTIARLYEGISNVVLCRNPHQLNINKWLDVYDNTSWYIVALLGNLLGHRLESALSDVGQGTDSSVPGYSDVDMQAMTEAFELDVSFSKVAGTRKNHSLKNIHDQSFRTDIALIAVATEPLRLLHTLYIATSCDDPTPAGDKWPVLLDLLNPEFSLLHHVLQYLGSLVRYPDQSSRLMIIVRMRGCTTYQEWARKWPADVRKLRCGVLGLASAVSRRQYNALRSNYGLFRIADARMNVQSRESVCRAELAKPRCCIAHGVARGIHDRAAEYLAKHNLPSTPETLVQAVGSLSFSLLMYAWFVRLSVASVERMHCLNGLVSAGHGRATLSTLAASSLIAQTRLQFNKLQKQKQQQQEQSLHAATATTATATMDVTDDDVIDTYAHLKRGLGESEVFKKRFLAAERAEHRLHSVRECHALLAAEFEAAGPEERAICKAHADYTRALVKQKKIREPTTPAPQPPQPIANNRSSSASALVPHTCAPVEAQQRTLITASSPRAPTIVQVHSSGYDGELAMAFNIPVGDTAVTQPWSPSPLNAFCAGRHCFQSFGAITKNDTEHDWHRLVTGVSKGDDFNYFAQKATYPQTCEGTCLLDPLHHRCMAAYTHTQTLSIIGAAVKSRGGAARSKIANVAADDYIVCIEAASTTCRLRYH